ncbi:MAG: hypothetical protein V1839_01160 [archaeon]
MSSKKGVDTIIAVLLVVMITIAAAGSFYFWYIRVQQEAQSKAEQSTSSFLTQINTCIKMPYFSYNLLTNTSEAQVQNCGSTPLTIGDGDDNVLISSEPCAFAVDSQICDICPFVIGPGAFGKFKMNMNRATCSGTNVTAAKLLSGEGNMQHKVTFSMEKSTVTASQSFVPEADVKCSVNLNGTASIIFPWISAPWYVLREGTAAYNLSLSSNIPQTFAISGSFNLPDCNVTYTNDSLCRSYNYPDLNPNMTAIASITVNPDTGALFLGCIYCSLGGDIGNLTTTVRSTDLATCNEAKTSTSIDQR